MANVADGATGTVLTAPSPQTSGLSLVMNPGEGYRYPTPPFYVIAHPNSQIPTVSIAEKLLVTAILQSTIAAGSNGQSLPQGTINVVDTTGWPSAGSVTIVTSNGAQVVTYTGKTGTTITGATGGTGTMSTGGLVMTDSFTIVRAQGRYTAKSIDVGWRISNAIFEDDLNNAAIISNEVPGGSVNGSNVDFTVASAGKVTGSLKVFKNGVRMKSGGNDYTETATGFTMVTAPSTGTVLLVDYVVAGALQNIGTNSSIFDETPAGLVNGSTTLYATARPYIAGSLEVFINGVKQKRGTHFTESSPSGGLFTMGDAPLTGDDIMINYQFNLNPSGNTDTVDGFHASSTPAASQLLVLDSSAKVPDAAMRFPIPDYANMSASKGSTWTADANGFVLIHASVIIFSASTVSGTVIINSKTVIDLTQGNNAGGGNGVRNNVSVLLPVKTGDVIGQTGTITVAIHYIPILWVG